MNGSKLFSCFLTIIIVIFSYAFYNPGIGLSYFPQLHTKIKDLCLILNFQFLTPKDGLPSDLNSSHSEPLFTDSELRQFTGINNGKIYLSILGKVFDVSKGKKYYGFGQNYHGFAGKDASKAFVTGDFSEKGLIDDISDLSLNELGDLREWVQKYEKDYLYKGKLIGRFYDSSGKATNFLKEIEDKLSLLSANQKVDEFYKKNYPPCNAEWTPESGSRVWCSRLSGGIKRDWIGFPRKYHQPGSGISRCACINPKEKTNNRGNFEIYENCEPNAISCYVSQNK